MLFLDNQQTWSGQDISQDSGIFPQRPVTAKRTCGIIPENGKARKSGVMDMEKKIDQLVAMVGQILEKQTEHRLILDEHTKILEENTKRLDGIEQRIDKIEKHLEYISYKLSEHDRDIYLLKKSK
jgi:hypothetical protein